MGGERARTRTKDGPAGAPPERDVPPRRPLGTVEAPPLDPGWEDAFLEVMRTPVRAGDHDAAQLRVLEFQGLLMSIDVPDAAALFARLNRRGDVLAMTFQHTFATATRRRLLARIESIAVHYEGPQPEPAPAAAEPAPPEHDLSGLWLLTAEDYEPVSKANAPTLGMKVLSTQHGHMAAVGATTYYDVELPRPMTFAEAAEFFYGDARPPELSTLSPDGKEPALRWRIGGPRDSWGVSKHRADFRTFFVAMRPEVQDALLGQLETQDVDVVRPDWYSQATADIVKATHRPPDGADIRRVPDDQVPVYVWRDGDVLYRYDTAAKNLQALKLDAGDDLGTRIYRNWVTYYIEQGWEIDKAMDQTVQDQREANIMMMGGFAMALAGATPLGRPRDIIVFARHQTPTPRFHCLTANSRPSSATSRRSTHRQ